VVLLSLPLTPCLPAVQGKVRVKEAGGHGLNITVDFPIALRTDKLIDIIYSDVLL